MTIAVTSGDPSGIGPEIVQKSWIYLKNNPSNEFFWIGDPLHLPDKSIPWQPIVHPNEVSENFSSALPVLVHKFTHPLKIGCHQPENANDIIKVIKKAVRLVKENKATALCTSPINKDVLNSGIKAADLIAELSDKNNKINQSPNTKTPQVQDEKQEADKEGLQKKSLISKTEVEGENDITEEKILWAEAWDEFRVNYQPNEAEIDAEVSQRRGTYAEGFAWNAERKNIVIYSLPFYLWDIFLMMIIMHLLN